MKMLLILISIISVALSYPPHYHNNLIHRPPWFPLVYPFSQVPYHFISTNTNPILVNDSLPANSTLDTKPLKVSNNMDVSVMTVVEFDSKAGEIQ